MAWARKSSGVVVMGGFLLNGGAIIPNSPSLFGTAGPDRPSTKTASKRNRTKTINKMAEQWVLSGVFVAW